MSDANWAKDAAKLLLDQLEDVLGRGTQDYRLCSFIEAAAILAAKDDDFAARIGALMEPERKT